MDRSVSIQLYNYLCYKLGTEDEVNTRRTLLTTLDFLSENACTATIFSGSRGEGLVMNDSDLDIMLLYKGIHVVEDGNTTKKLNSFVLETYDTKPGYVLLKLFSSSSSSDILMNLCIQSRTPVKSGNCFRLQTNYFLSSERVKSIYHSISSNLQSFKQKIHGPCVSDQDDAVDKAICLRCRSWVRQADHWPLRNREWPSNNLIRNVVEYGVLIVPIGWKNSKNEHLEWRISFSVAEKLLIHAFTHTQFLCYALLKVLLKEIINKYQSCEGVLCSYFIKTTIFWVSEEIPQTEWKPTNLSVCFMRVLERLIHFVKYDNLPHYFLNDCNLFENKFTVDQKSDLIKVLSQAKEEGIYCLRRSQTASGFFRTTSNFFNNACLSDLDKTCNQINAVFSSCFLIGSAIPGTQRLWKFLKNFKYTLVDTSIFYGICRIEGLHSITVSGLCNKDHFIRQKISLPLFVVGSRGDSTLGWLYIATYFYCRKQYRNALTVLYHVLSKCTQSKLFSKRDRLKATDINAIEAEALEQNYMTEHDLYRRYVMQGVHLSHRYDLYPIEMKTEIAMNHNLVANPVIFGYFLTFLCNYHLHNYGRSQQALQNLEFETDTLCLVWGNPLTFSNALHCLGMAYIMTGRLRLASKAFATSFKFTGTNYAKFMMHYLSKRY